MGAFPTLTAKPEFPIKEGIVDTLIRTSQEAGPVHSRNRYPRTRKTFGISYKNLDETDTSALLTHLVTTTNGGADNFTWTHPITSVEYTVIYQAPFEMSYDYYGDQYRASCEFVLEEV